MNRFLTSIGVALLGGILAAGAWFFVHLLYEPTAERLLDKWERESAWSMIVYLMGSGFVYGAIGGAFLGRRSRYWPVWIIVGSIIVGVVGLALLYLVVAQAPEWIPPSVLAGAGLLVTLLARLAPERAPATPTILRQSAPEISLVAVIVLLALLLQPAWYVILLIAVVSLAAILGYLLVVQSRRIRALEQRVHEMLVRRSVER